MNEAATSTPSEAFGRYLLYPAIARGGMATVHPARLVGAEGFTRLVAAKRLHPQFTDDPDFVTMFHDEACIASRIHHPNVVPVLDVVMSGNELILVQEYVHGVPLAQLIKRAHIDQTPIPVDVTIAILAGVLAGLHAAHEVRDELDRPLEIVHRDVSPQNVMVSVDGIPRLLDFGIAKARTSTHHTREGVFKGKLAYMAPEQLRMDNIDRTIDVYATGLVAWEMLVNRRVYDGRHELQFVQAVVGGAIPTVLDALAETRDTIDDARWEQLVALQPIITRAMAPEREDRFATAADMMRALLEVRAAATALDVAAWVREAGADYLDQRQKTLAANEESWRRTSVYGPASGRQRTGGATLILDTPSGFVPVAPSSPPVTAEPPPAESGAFRVAASAPPVAGEDGRGRRSRLLPWVTAGAFLVAAILGGALRGIADPAPAAVSAKAETSGAGLVADTATAQAAAAPAALTPSPASAAADTFATPPLTSSVTLLRATHAAPLAPPPPPPRAIWVARSPSPPSAPAAMSAPSPATTSAPARADCNPPFYFEGQKKIFKPNCL
ncbi:MAG TPA: serine/threonine-protein kinase [Labilithrix sp.]|nr:serine/threonine-protein kinase [Labilithrix sp.]